MGDPILYEQSNDVAVIRINRPRARNALNWQAQELFAARIAMAAAEPDLRVLIITGTGQEAFVAGGDLHELAQATANEAGDRLYRTMSRALQQLTELPFPVIAAINGDAIGGGCELLTACDLRLARAGARLRFGQVLVGLSTGWGGGSRLVRQVGQSRAREWLLTGRALTAGEAQAAGFIHRVVADTDDVLAAAQAWAAELVRLPHDALATLKALTDRVGDGPLAAAYQVERDLFLALYGSANHQEALRAFQARRAPRFNDPRPEDSHE